MTPKKRKKIEQRIEKNFQELKRRAEIREQYGVFTRGMLEDLFDRKFEEKFGTIRQKLQTVDEKLNLFSYFTSHIRETLDLKVIYDKQ